MCLINTSTKKEREGRPLYFFYLSNLKKICYNNLPVDIRSPYLAAAFYHTGKKEVYSINMKKKDLLQYPIEENKPDLENNYAWEVGLKAFPLKIKL